MYLLGIETSCDETSASIVENGNNILSNVVVSQIKDHAQFYGVVPEIASRKHLENINPVIDEAFAQADIQFTDIDAVAVVYKPGLIGALLIGLVTAKAFAFQQSVPLVPVNHVEAHLFAPHFEHTIPFPNIGLVLSGGHTLIIKSYSHTKHQIIGSTIDDAIGEAFDKIAKYFQLGYPGGPIIDEMAKMGDENAYTFPQPNFKDKSNPYLLSYSGLKTAVIHQLDKFMNSGHEKSLPNILASFQKSAINVLIELALKSCHEHNIEHVVLSGGVACNSYLRDQFYDIKEINSYFPVPELSMDNAAMVAGLGYYLLQNGVTADLTLNAYSKIVKKGKQFNGTEPIC